MPVQTTDGDDKGARVARGFSASEKQLSPFESLVSLGGITHSDLLHRAIQILIMQDALDRVDIDRVVKCEDIP